MSNKRAGNRFAQYELYAMIRPEGADKAMDPGPYPIKNISHNVGICCSSWVHGITLSWVITWLRKNRVAALREPLYIRAAGNFIYFLETLFDHRLVTGDLQLQGDPAQRIHGSQVDPGQVSRLGVVWDGLCDFSPAASRWG